MKQVLVLLTCDPCMAWKEREVSDGVETVAVSAGQTLDLCPDHRDALSRVWALVAEWGTTPGRTANARGGTRRQGGAPSGTPAAAVPVGEGDDAPGTAPAAPKTRRGGKRARARRAAASAPPGSFACPLCTDTPASAHALTQHLRAAHDRTGAEVFGGTCPVCNYTGTAAGLGVHGRMAHGHTSVAALFAAATAAGDPHGVIASRVEVFGQAADA